MTNSCYTFIQLHSSNKTFEKCKHLFPIEVRQEWFQETHDSPSARQENHVPSGQLDVDRRRPCQEATVVGEQRRRNT